jgi:hypothetical protein
MDKMAAARNSLFPGLRSRSYGLSTPDGYRLLLAFGHSASAYNYSTVSEHCDDIWNFTGDAGLEARTEVTNVTYLAASGTTPAYCAVIMYVYVYTGIEMYLPAEGKDWKGVYSAHGCGGHAGSWAWTTCLDMAWTIWCSIAEAWICC